MSTQRPGAVTRSRANSRSNTTLLDRADEAVRQDRARPGHNHWVQARSKNARVDFDASLQERFDYICPELSAALDAIEDESVQTCQVCGAPGEERPAHYYSTLCAEHAQPRSNA